MSREAVLLCFLAGANSIFFGETLLTTPNPAPNEDVQLLEDLGMRPWRLVDTRDPSRSCSHEAELAVSKARSSAHP